MPVFAANISTMFTEVPFTERFALAAAAGFTAVEFQFPYDWPPELLAEKIAASQLQVVLHNLPAGDWQAGERGIACIDGRQEEFRQGVARAIEYARILGCRRLNCLAGIPPAHLGAQLARDTLIDNLRYGAAELAAHGIELLIEPLNHHDVPGFLLGSSRSALVVIEQCASPNLRLQYDIYHMQRAEGELAATLERHLALIGHVQLADNPGRHEPGTGEINFRWLLQHLDTIGYTGWVGCEYTPLHDTQSGLGWIEQLHL